MREPVWVNYAEAVIAHDLEIATHGGSTGIRGRGLLESALARPKDIWVYSKAKPPLTTLAAAYAMGLSSNQPFVDGNKRTALLVSFVFLDVNGYQMTATQEDAFLTFLGLAAGEVSERQLARWFARNSTR